MSILQAQVKKLIGNSQNILQEFDENLIFKELLARNLEWDDFYQMVETWVIEHIYEILFYKIIKIDIMIIFYINLHYNL